MDVHTRDCVFVILLLLGHNKTVTALTGLDNETSLNLDCTNDFDTLISCDFEAQNCSVHNVSLQNMYNNEREHCVPVQCISGRCCCSVKASIVSGGSHTAMIWKGGQMMESKIIVITQSIKPKVPKITSVEEVEGKFLVKWTTNMDGWFANTLHANVTYHKKGDTEKVTEKVNPTIMNDLRVYELDGRNLEPSTTYVVSVKSFIDETNKYSDSSPEFEFTTPASTKFLHLAIIISLSIASVLISSFIFVCFVKLKRKWWDTVAKCPNPKLLVMHPYEQAFLRPELLTTSSVCVEPLIPDDCNSWSKGSLTDSSSDTYQKSSGISTGSSSLSYANAEPTDIAACVNEALSKAFPNIPPMSFLSTNLPKESNKDSGSFSSGRADNPFSFDNKTYTILIPSCSHQIVMDGSQVQTQASMCCDSAYHPSEADTTVTRPDQQLAAFQLPNLALMVPSLVATDMSYQQCKADSGQLSYAEDSSLSSNSSGAHTMASCEAGGEAGFESFDEAVSCETKPSGESEVVKTGDDTYQAFQNGVGQPGPERKEFSVKYPMESFTKITPASSHNVQGGQCLSELQRNLFSLISAEKPVPVITSSGYQSV